MRKNVDIHAEAMALADALVHEGRPQAKERIDEAIAGGATGTESLFRLHAALGELARSGALRGRAFKRRARKLRWAIWRQLRSGL